MTNSIQQKIKIIWQEKCPKCGNGDVYSNHGNCFVEIPKMNNACSVCHYTFEREQGYFIGAMYLSYGLAVLQGILAFVLCNFIPGINNTMQIIITCLTMVIFSFPNFRLSRILWMHIFPD